MNEPANEPRDAARRFATTRWSVVLTAGRERGEAGDSAARDALAVLCRDYWYPLYAYIRRHGSTAEEAQDLTQGFFVRLLEKDVLFAADPQRGRFRSFLLTALKHFLSNERDRAAAIKRGDGVPMAPLPDVESAERQYSVDSADPLTPDHGFEREWALTLLANVLKDLQDQYNSTGRGVLFESLKPALAGDPPAGFYARLAEEHASTEGAIQVAASRLRKRYRELLREHIARTVESAEQVEEELRDLFRAVRGRR